MRARTVARLSVLAAIVGAALSSAATSYAADCDLLSGKVKEICESEQAAGGSTGGGVPVVDNSTLDPMSSLAKSFAEAAAWVVDQLSNAVTATADVDFTNGSFLKTYALTFAASTVLVVVIWLWAVVKRAVRGAPLTTAIGEAIGLLWLAVLASAFTPLVLYTVVSAVDSITAALAGGSEHAKFFDAFSSALKKNKDGGPLIQIVLSGVSIVAAGVVWFELVVRAALLYVGAVLGTVVYSGLVDKELWSRVRKWVAIMTAIILIKPIVVIVLQLASALTDAGAQDSVGAIVSGLAIIVISIVASALIFRFIPGMGDEIVAARRDSYDPASRQSAAIVTRPVQGVSAGISAHAGRDSASRPAASQSASASASTSIASGGMAAHSSRPTSSGNGGSRPSRPDVPSQDNR